MTRGWMWPAVLVALLAGSAVFDIAFIVVAVDDPSFAVERDYYRKALAWDETMAQESLNRDLGWSVDARLSPAAAREGGLGVTIWVKDRNGARIDDANVAVELFHHARAGQVWTPRLAALGSQGYVGRLPEWRPGLWELRIRASRGTETFTATMNREVGPMPISSRPAP